MPEQEGTSLKAPDSGKGIAISSVTIRNTNCVREYVLPLGLLDLPTYVTIHGYGEQDYAVDSASLTVIYLIFSRTLKRRSITVKKQ